VKHRVDLIDQFAELVVSEDTPRGLAERTLEVIMSLNNGRSGAVFTCHGEKVALFASRAIDQWVLDGMEKVWTDHRGTLLAGESFYVSDRLTERRLPPAEGNDVPVGSFAIVPVFAEESLLALIYVDSAEPHFCTAHDLERLAKFSRIIAKAVTESTPKRDRAQSEAWVTYLERTPVEDMEREKLLLLLNRNEWNIARVARLMGVTRRTIYLRLQRYNIPRERVAKSKVRGRRSAR
jgi:GAF domain-containing protein